MIILLNEHPIKLVLLDLRDPKIIEDIHSKIEVVCINLDDQL